MLVRQKNSWLWLIAHYSNVHTMPVTLLGSTVVCSFSVVMMMSYILSACFINRNMNSFRVPFIKIIHFKLKVYLDWKIG
jgi:hypothetical protein